MTGSLSRTATAYDGGSRRRIRGGEARLAARVRGEEAAGKVPVRGTQTAYEADVAMGKGASWSKARKSSGRHVCRCGGYVERRSHVLPREICLSVRHGEVNHERTREAVRLPMGRQKSAESASRPRTTV
jgi:hypothetical protein